MNRTPTIQGIHYHHLKKVFYLADVFVLLLLCSLVYGVMNLAAQWKGEFQAVVAIDLSLWALPKYAFYSASRGMVAYFFSLTFALVYGYAAAKSRRSERFLVLLLDILQSIPVLGFLPGLVLGLISLFPLSNFGLELACVLMIFSSQAWNMCFSFYASVRSVPSDLGDMGSAIGLSWWSRLVHLEIPYAAVGLVWNSLLSMAGGWFFLTICESFSLGERNFRLPGLGSYMAVAIDRNDHMAMAYGVLAMTTVILIMDFLIWRPLLVWVQRFRFENSEGVEVNQSLMLQMFQESRLLRRLQVWLNRIQWRRQVEAAAAPVSASSATRAQKRVSLQAQRRASQGRAAATILKRTFRNRIFIKVVSSVLLTVVLLVASYCVIKLGVLLHGLSLKFWILLLRDALWSTLRILGSMILATAWTVPVGILIGLSPRATRIAQPIIQVVAAFPAPMLYPLVLSLLFKLHVGLDIASMVLMVMGAQWYILFNVLAGTMGISHDMQATLNLTTPRRWTHWKRLYLPGIFPSLVVGWITAAGGFWNSAIVTEYVRYKGGSLRVNGLGSTISRAAEEANFPALAGSLLMIILIVVLMNRLVWQRLSELANRRFQFER